VLWVVTQQHEIKSAKTKISKTDETHTKHANKQKTNRTTQQAQTSKQQTNNKHQQQPPHRAHVVVWCVCTVVVVGLLYM
jgi:Flp pilus assembly protein TadB